MEWSGVEWSGVESRGRVVREAVVNTGWGGNGNGEVRGVSNHPPGLGVPQLGQQSFL